MTSSKTAIKIHSVESQTRLFFLINPTSRELRELKKKKKSLVLVDQKSQESPSEKSIRTQGPS